MGQNSGGISKELEEVKTKKMTVHYRDHEGKERTARGSKKKMIALTELMKREGKWISTDHH
jgi:hypothetical protein